MSGGAAALSRDRHCRQRRPAGAGPSRTRRAARCASSDRRRPARRPTAHAAAARCESRQPSADAEPRSAVRAMRHVGLLGAPRPAPRRTDHASGPPSTPRRPLRLRCDSCAARGPPAAPCSYAASAMRWPGVTAPDQSKRLELDARGRSRRASTTIPHGLRVHDDLGVRVAPAHADDLAHPLAGSAHVVQVFTTVLSDGGCADISRAAPQRARSPLQRFWYSGPSPPSGVVRRPPFAVIAPHCTQLV